MQRIYLIFLTSLLSGCLIIPTGLPGPEPYDKKAIADLGTKNLDREEIRASMGQPNVVRGNGTIWIYGKPQDITELWEIMGYMVAIADINNYFVVVIEFSDDVATHIELIDLGWNAPRVCTTTGICVTWVPTGKGVKELNSESVMVNAKPEDDAAAKRFESVDGMCSVYIFTDLFSYVSTDFGHSTLIGREDYIHTLLQPGLTGYQVR